jgi:guanosine-3',5'-bis(diphosphate) 3'-pyrophosphohydrolase
MTDVKEILNLIPDAKPADKKIIERAYHFAEAAHGDQKRKSGESYFVHPFAVAKTLAELNLDAETIAAGLLHDVLEDTETREEEMIREFGQDITEIVKGTTKLGKLKYRGRERYVENLRRFFLAISKDVRVLIIKLADRLHNVQTLGYLPPEKAKRIAVETIEIYAKLANRLGIGKLKSELEDYAFPFACPEENKKIDEILKEKKYVNEKYLEKIKITILNEVATQGIKIMGASYRLKRKYSLCRKIGKKGDISKIFDFVAIRLIVPTIEDCYRAMGIVHGAWQPVPNQIKDYIALPKPNGYRSLHTTVFIGDGGMVEVQIRTPEMHQEAEYGIAAHFMYKENLHKKTQDGKDNKWLDELALAQRAIKNPSEYAEHLRLNLFQNRIFVFTPEGDIINLPKGATPVDFAYHIHSEVGDKTSGAKFNNKMTPLDAALENGDIVEIITKKSATPSKKWLDFTKTGLAKKHIKNALIAKL